VGPGLLTDEVSRSLRYTTLGTTPLDERSACCWGRYPTTHNTDEKHPKPRRNSNPRLQQRADAEPQFSPRNQCEWSINRLVNAITAIRHQVSGERRTRELLILTCGPEEGGDIRMEKCFTFCALHQRSMPSLSHQGGEEPTVYSDTSANEDNSFWNHIR
jgi:hypothetical protein